MWKQVSFSGITGVRYACSFWIVMAVIVAMIAKSKGYNPVGWFFYGLLLWPIALVHILLTREGKGLLTEKYKTCPKCGAEMPPLMRWCTQCNTEILKVKALPTKRECPFCRELIKAKAIKCKHCGSEVEGI